MAGIRRLGVLVGIGFACGGLITTGGLTATARAAVACPTVSAAGVVTPAPAPGVYWWECDLAGADLAGANLTGANLTGAVLRSANLSGTTLTGAMLTGVISGGVTGMPAALPPNWVSVDGYLVGPGAELDSASLASANLSGLDLAGSGLDFANLGGADLSGANLADALLEHASLAGADLANANLTGAGLTLATSGGITGTPSALPVNWQLGNGYLMGPDADLTGADLSGLNLAGVDLATARLTNADVSGTQFAQATLTSVITGGLTGIPASLPQGLFIAGGYLAGPSSYLVGANLPNLDLVGADLAGANLASANLAGTSLVGANLTQASLSRAALAGADLSGATLAGTNFDSATLTSANLDKADLSTASLTSVVSGGVTGTPSKLPANWEDVDGYLVGPGTNLSQASLPDVNLANADLQGAYLANADLSSANLSGANLRTASLDQTNLTNANLTKADLSYAMLTSPVVSGTNFTDATLYQIVDWQAGAVGTPAVLPPGFYMLAGYLVSSGVTIRAGQLPGADLTGADLNGVSVTYSNLANANLDDADLRNASLEGDTVTGATFTGATWEHTICPDFTNSDKYVAGCFSPVDNVPPTVTLTGPGNNKVYVTGAVPTAGCKTTDDGTVATAARLTVTTTGKNGFGRFTATCAGAVDLAGNVQRVTVSVSYTVVGGLHGFIAPVAGATVARSVKTMTVGFRLTTSNGAPIASSAAAALAAAHDIRVSLRGPGISVVTVGCGWNAAQKAFACAIRIPSGVRTGSTQAYTLTAGENVGTGWLNVPGVRGAVNPEVIHFR
jgi:uncharacterized protein YjbI with pentapeptide repeats